MELKGKKVLVTGGTGFIGRHLVKRLVEERCKVASLSEKPQLGIIKKDLVKDDLSDISGFDVVFHLAGSTDLRAIEENPEIAFNSNVTGTFRLLEALRKYNKNLEKFIFLSSSSVYGDAKVPVKEDSELKPVGFYGMSKLLAENICVNYRDTYGMPIIIVRAFNVYGPGMNEFSLIPKAIKTILKNDKFNVYNEEVTRDFIFIQDLIDGLINVSTKAKLDTYNIGSGQETKIGDLIKEIQKGIK